MTGAWMRLIDQDGREQSAVMVLGEHTFTMRPDPAGATMLISDWTREPDPAECALEVVGLAHHVNATNAMPGLRAVARVTP